MGWASRYIVSLSRGETVRLRPRGNSMQGRIESGQLCTVEPINPTTLSVGDIVLCKVHGREYLHLVKAIDGIRFHLANNRGGSMVGYRRTRTLGNASGSSDTAH